MYFVAAFAIALLVLAALVLGTAIADLRRRINRSQRQRRTSSGRRESRPSDWRFDRQS